MKHGAGLLLGLVVNSKTWKEVMVLGLLCIAIWVVCSPAGGLVGSSAVNCRSNNGAPVTTD